MVPTKESLPPYKEIIEQLSIYEFCTLLTISPYCNRGGIVNKIHFFKNGNSGRNVMCCLCHILLLVKKYFISSSHGQKSFKIMLILHPLELQKRNTVIQIGGIAHRRMTECAKMVEITSKVYICMDLILMLGENKNDRNKQGVDLEFSRGADFCRFF